MRDILTDMVRQTKDLFDVIKVVGTEKTTKLSAVDKDKTLFLAATLTDPLPDFEGEFGISNLGLLDGLLNFTSYKTDTAKFSVKRETKKAGEENIETVTAFVFKDVNGKGATFRTMDPKLIPEQAQIANIPWTVTVVPSKSKIAEFSQLFKILSEVEKSFLVNTEDGDLVFSIGQQATSTHNASMVFESGVNGELKGDISFDVSQFLSLMKIGGSNPMTMNITSKGVLGVTVDAPTGKYNYFLRAKRG